MAVIQRFERGARVRLDLDAIRSDNPGADFSEEQADRLGTVVHQEGPWLGVAWDGDAGQWFEIHADHVVRA